MNTTLDYNSIIYEILAAADPYAAVKQFLCVEHEMLICDSVQYSLHDIDRIIVVGAGKASGRMAQTVEEILGDLIDTGLVIVKDGYIAPTKRIRLAEAAHPVPDERSLAIVSEMAQLLGSLTKRDIVLCLISGGGSALMAAPVSKTIRLSDVQNLTTLLLRSGAGIEEINIVRKHLMRLSGGRLAALAAPARVVSLIISDIVGSPLSMIASGPTVAGTTSNADAIKVLDKYELTNKIAPEINEVLQTSVAELPKSTHQLWNSVQNCIIADNRIAAEAAAKATIQLGFQTIIQTTSLEGEALEVGKQIAELAKQIRSGQTLLKPPVCVVYSGETTVTVRGTGKGGRNQELALAAAIALEGIAKTSVLALGTDGTDGPTDAAGAIITNETVWQARQLGLDAQAFLNNNDSYTFFDATHSLIKIGPTNTNVNDVVMLFVA
jgi:glycerate 2-kinase